MKKACRDFLGNQGPGYRDFGKYIQPQNFTNGLRELASQMKRAAAVGWGAGTPTPSQGTPTEFLFEGVRTNFVPTRLVNDMKSSVNVIRRFELNGIEVSPWPNDHLPAHMHVDSRSGKWRTRYLWPDNWPNVSVSQPYPGNYLLNRKEQNALTNCVRRYGAKSTKG